MGRAFILRYLYLPAYQYNPHTTASFPYAHPDTVHGYISRELHSYQHAQAEFQSMLS